MSKAYDAALRLLTRREHGAFELTTKLKQKGYTYQEIGLALEKCQELGLQCDKRFSESFCRMRIRQGYGPAKIQQELKHLRIEDELIANVLHNEKENWKNYALQVWLKKYKTPASCFEEIQKQKRFLQYRGFSTDTIAEVVKKEV